MYTARYKKSKEQCTGQCIQHVKKTRYRTVQDNVSSTVQHKVQHITGKCIQHVTKQSTEQCTVKFKIQPIQFSKSNERHSIKSVQYSVLYCTALYIQMHSVHYNEEYTP